MKNNTTKVSEKRISQIRKIIENTNQDDLNLMISDVTDSIRIILLAALPQNLKKNKLQKIMLHSFLNSYISGMNLEEIINLTAKIEYYENKLEKCAGDIEEDFIGAEDLYLIPLNNRIERLLLNGSIIPNTIDKTEFHKEMLSLMNRLDSGIENDAKKLGFSLGFIDSGILLETIRFMGTDSYSISHGEEMDSYINSINLTITLNELNEIEEGKFKYFNDFDDDFQNNISFKIQCNKFGEEGVDKQGLIKLFENKGYLKDGNYFTLYNNDHIEIKAYLDTIRFEGNNSQSYTLEIYAKRKKDKISSTQFLELSMFKLSLITQDVINDIYSKFGAPKKRHHFDLETIFEKIESSDWGYGGAGLGVGGKTENGEKKNLKKEKDDRKIKYCDIILGDNEMREFEMLKKLFGKEEHFQKYGVEIPKGTVLHGPAGTGKTLFARKIANEIDAEFISISPDQVLSKWVGDNEKNIKKEFKNAKKIASKGKKVILFFDEADGLFEKRNETKTHKEGMISVILQEMDGINENSMKNIFVFFTTNRLKAIDAPVLSRFDKKIEIGLPHYKERVKLFKLYISEKIKKSKSNIFKDIDHDFLSKKTKGKSGRFIKQLINNAVLSFAYFRIENPRSKLITTKNIIDGIGLIEEEDKTKNKIGFGNK